MYVFLSIYGVLGILTAILAQIGLDFSEAKNPLTQAEIHPAIMRILVILVAFALWWVVWIVAGVGLYKEMKNK